MIENLVKGEEPILISSLLLRYVRAMNMVTLFHVVIPLAARTRLVGQSYVKRRKGEK